mgnify:CR=1 FL=1|jgi:hypothetical protein
MQSLAMHYSMNEIIYNMLKNTVCALLTILIDDFKFRVEASYDEIDSDKWSTFHDQLIKMRNTIKNGGIK